MDIIKANTRAFAHYNSFHEGLNRSVKTAAVALIILEDDIAKARRSIAGIKSECYALKSLWGGMPDWSSAATATEAIQIAKHDLGAAGVVKAFAAFDVFMETLDGELNAWNTYSQRKGRARRTSDASRGDSKSNSKCLPSDATEETEPNAKVLRFFERQGWDIMEVDYLIPIYTYFRLLRNCVAHSDARATPALQAAAHTERWSQSIVEWKKKTNDLTMPIPHQLVAGSQITITHKEALLASSMLRMLAWSMSRHAVASLGETGLLYVLVSKILKEKVAALVGGKQHLSRLHHHLKLVYRIDQLTIADTKTRLEGLGLWEEWKAWHESVAASRNPRASRSSPRRHHAVSAEKDDLKRASTKAKHKA